MLIGRFYHVKLDTGYCGCDEDLYIRFPIDWTEKQIYSAIDDMAYEHAYDCKDCCLNEGDDEQDYFDEAMGATCAEPITAYEWLENNGISEGYF